jgi:acetoin utilization deacetylase AcuC-like enzyme
MVHRAADSRLLTHVISHEKEYAKQVETLLDSSNAALSTLAAYASASPPKTSQTVLAAVGSLASADEAFKGYAEALALWRNQLVELKTLEDDVGNIVRDREIL